MKVYAKKSIGHLRIKKILHGIPFLILISLVLLRFVFYFANGVEKEQDLLQIDFFDVGQSDAALIRCGGMSMLIDAGTAGAGETLLLELQALEVSHLDHVIITHPHEDHYGNLRRLLPHISVGQILISDIPCTDTGYLILQDDLLQRGISPICAETGQVFSIGEADVHILSAGGDDPNNGSIVLRIDYRESRLLFMGDAEEKTEAALLERYGAALDCDLLKVGHHGSNTASTLAFIHTVTPDIAVISCGKDNEYGFPHNEVLAHCTEVGASVYRTDTQGTIRLNGDGQAFYERGEKPW